MPASPETGPPVGRNDPKPRLAGTLAAPSKDQDNMKAMRYAGLAGLAALGAQAQAIQYGMPADTHPRSMVITATRGLQPVPTLRDTVVITRAEMEDAGTLSLGEVLERSAGMELRATGGPGQPESIFIRGAGSAGTLVLIDGLRAGSSSAGTTAIEALPIDMIERIEVVKGPMSSLYGSEAIGGVIQIFTRDKKVPNFFANAGYGADSDRAGSAGIATVEGNTRVLHRGGRAQGGRAQRHQLAQHVQLRPRPRPARERVRQHARRAQDMDRRDAGARRLRVALTHRLRRGHSAFGHAPGPQRPDRRGHPLLLGHAASRAGGRPASRWAKAATR